LQLSAIMRTEYVHSVGQLMVILTVDWFSTDEFSLYSFVHYGPFGRMLVMMLTTFLCGIVCNGFLTELFWISTIFICSMSSACFRIELSRSRCLSIICGGGGLNMNFHIIGQYPILSSKCFCQSALLDRLLSCI